MSQARVSKPFIFAALLLGVVICLGVQQLLKSPTESDEPETSTTSNPDTRKAAKPLRTPHLVRKLIDPSKHLDEQIEAIRALPTDLTQGEFQALIDLLYDGVPETMNAATWSTIQNEIMEVLRHRRFDIKEYPTAIAGILNDREADPIMRDYAAQHLTLYLSDRADALEKETIHHSLDSLLAILKGTREAGHQATGTTLMALCDLNQKQPKILEEHRPELSQAVLHLLNPEHHVTFSNRISAIQAAGRLRVEKALPQIREMARSSEIKASFTLNSIAALGYFANPKDKPFLEQMAQSQSKFRFAAQTALRNYSSITESSPSSVVR